MSRNQLKREIQELLDILGDQDSEKDKFPFITAIADQCPEVAGLLYDEKDYLISSGLSEIQDLGKRTDSIIRDPTWNRYELKIGKAIIKCMGNGLDLKDTYAFSKH